MSGGTLRPRVKCQEDSLLQVTVWGWGVGGDILLNPLSRPWLLGRVKLTSAFPSSYFISYRSASTAKRRKHLPRIKIGKCASLE